MGRVRPRVSGIPHLPQIRPTWGAEFVQDSHRIDARWVEFDHSCIDSAKDVLNSPCVCLRVRVGGLRENECRLDGQLRRSTLAVVSGSQLHRPTLAVMSGDQPQTWWKPVESAYFGFCVYTQVGRRWTIWGTHFDQVPAESGNFPPSLKMDRCWTKYSTSVGLRLTRR